jgi:hypothetical protein
MAKNGPINGKTIENVLVDFVLRCIKGPYLNNFIFINLVSDGETLGNDPSEDLTLCIDDQKLSPKHCKIHYDYSDKKYVL